ncbi:hypothetical protein AVEN_95616-1 [Araneus ventricosus]|uniref:Uncharacterized protein n=1 Tax=Araneus ventricosus TaxID=182803 RepID=A0A4Y2IJ54_ARAVE|nr:hypothetical protein AVEN_95616-1 [Araneus ventricosus]
MLPVDSRQLENVKGELLKLTKKETMAQRGLERRVEETEEQNNGRLRECWSYVSLPHFFAPPGNGTLFSIARATPSHVWNDALFEIARARYLEVTADFQLWHTLARTGETEEQNNSLLTVMAQRGQKRIAEETEEQRNSRLSERKAEETEDQRNSRLSDMAHRSQERRAEENRRTKE